MKIKTETGCKITRNEHPILFSSKMVQAILEGRKTQTRRVILPTTKYGIPGDRLWVKETFRWFDALSESDKDGVFSGWMYKASTDQSEADNYKWKPSIFMPKKASRITLQILDIRAERVQDISESDAWSEGVVGKGTSRYNGEGIDLFHTLWDSINEKRGYGWNANPHVYVIEFKRG
jgi:hypothetical protein